MTKVIILGQEPEQKKPKRIEFVELIDHSKQFIGPRYTPKDFKNIELVAKNWDIAEILDLMFAYDDDRNNGFLFLGHFNDGVVE
jgi:hypothetical protein